MIIFKYDPALLGPNDNCIHARGEAVWKDGKRMFFGALINFHEDLDITAARTIVAKDAAEWWGEYLSKVHEGEFSLFNVEYRLATACHAPWHPIVVTL
jgi:hypothetical protein